VAAALAVAAGWIWLWAGARLAETRDLRKQQREVTLQRAEERRRLLYAPGIQAAASRIKFGDVEGARQILQGLRPAPGEPDPRGFEWHHLELLTRPPHEVLRGHVGDVYHVQFRPDGRALVSCGTDRTLRIWDVATRGLVRTMPVRAGDRHVADINWVAYARDGRSLVTASDDATVKLWDPDTGRLRGTLTGHEREVVAALFTADGRGIVSGSRDHTLILWDVATGRALRRVDSDVEEVESLALSPDGCLLGAGGSHGVALFDLGTGSGSTEARLTLRHRVSLEGRRSPFRARGASS
jgi:hypothetical protein